MTARDFESDASRAHQRLSEDKLWEVFDRHFPGEVQQFTVQRQGCEKDRLGVDVEVELLSGWVNVEMKVRELDPLQTFNSDDLALETFSDVDRGVPGWTRDERKASDYVVWYWVPTDRSVCFQFHELRRWFSQNWERLRQRYGAKRQRFHAEGRVWFSECVFVPRAVVSAGVDGLWK